MNHKIMPLFLADIKMCTDHDITSHQLSQFWVPTSLLSQILIASKLHGTSADHFSGRQPPLDPAWGASQPQAMGRRSQPGGRREGATRGKKRAPADPLRGGAQALEGGEAGSDGSGGGRAPAMLQRVRLDRAQQTCSIQPGHEDSKEDGGCRIERMPRSGNQPEPRPAGRGGPRQRRGVLSQLRARQPKRGLRHRDRAIKAELKRAKSRPCICGGHKTGDCQPFTHPGTGRAAPEAEDQEGVRPRRPLCRSLTAPGPRCA